MSAPRSAPVLLTALSFGIASVSLACGEEPARRVADDAETPSSATEPSAPGSPPVASDAGPPIPIAPCAALGATPHVRLCQVTRVGAGVVVGPASAAGLGKNFQGPTVVKAPPWLPSPLGAYYMYFAAHDGAHIRLAFADDPAGPWTVHAPGSLRDTEVAPFSNTIASPDIHVFPATQKVRMYFHTDSYPGSSEQWSGVAESSDGSSFTLASTANIAKYYLRVFPYQGRYYGLQKGWSTAPAELGVSPDGIQPFAPIKTLSHGSIRHMGVHLEGDVLLVFFSKIGDAPERIYLSTIDLAQPPASWDLSAPIEVLRPSLAHEGADRPVAPSVKGPATGVNELRDPFVFVDGGRTYLYYTVAGESGIAMAELRYERVWPAR